MGSFRLGGIVLHGVHEPDTCAGRPCIIHNPIRPLKERDLTWRNDRGIFEEHCKHGIGHPVPETPKGYNTVHGCDGCCADMKGDNND